MLATISTSTAQILYVFSFVVLAVAAFLAAAERNIMLGLVASGLALYVLVAALSVR